MKNSSEHQKVPMDENLNEEEMNQHLDTDEAMLQVEEDTEIINL